MDSSELRLIAIDYLFEGMTLAEDIYNYSGKLLLLAKGSVLTEHQLTKLRGFNANHRNISVFEATYQTLVERGLPKTNALAQSYLEEKVHYIELKETTADLLEKTAKSGVISKEDADGIAAEMLDRLHTFETSLLLQCINSPGKMDEYLHRHSVNVGLLNGMIGKWLGLGEEEIDQLVLAGLVHDVGKTKIPSELLDAPRSLTVCEFEVIKTHAVYSYELLGTDPRFAEPVKRAAMHHHEKMNGWGYPNGLSARDIPLFARITAVSDVYDAMVSNRSYKAACSPFSILSGMARQRFSDLDIGLVALFTRQMPAALAGKTVLLSDGSIGTVRFLREENLEYPLVEVNGKITATDENLSCVRLIWEQ